MILCWRCIYSWLHIKVIYLERIFCMHSCMHHFSISRYEKIQKAPPPKNGDDQFVRQITCKNNPTFSPWYHADSRKKFIHVEAERKKICCNAIKYNLSCCGACEERVIGMTHWCNPFKTLWLGLRLLWVPLQAPAIIFVLDTSHRLPAISRSVSAALSPTFSGCQVSFLSRVHYMTSRCIKEHTAKIITLLVLYEAEEGGAGILAYP